jgi:DNA-binding MarR family transcriptional regulator
MSDHIRRYLDVQGGLGSNYRRALARRFGLDPQEMAAVLHLARGELTAGQLSHALVLSVEDVVALVDGLEEAGHAVRRPHAEDPHVAAVALSAATLVRLEETTRPLVVELDALAMRLQPHERETIGRFLEAVTLISEREAEAAARAVVEGDAPLGSMRERRLE